VFFYHPLFADVAGFRLGAFLVSRNGSAHFPVECRFSFTSCWLNKFPASACVDSSLGGDLLALASKLSTAVVSAFSKDVVVLRPLVTEQAVSTEVIPATGESLQGSPCTTCNSFPRRAETKA